MNKIFNYLKFYISIERWKYNQSLDIYVSNHGRFKNKEGIIQPFEDKDNYFRWNNRFVHKIVMETWNSIPGCAFFTINHKDNNTHNNSLSNLEWVIPKKKKESKTISQSDKEKESVNEEKNEKKEPMVMVNGMELTLSSAKALLQMDRTFSNTVNFDKIFKEVVLNPNTEYRYGRYTIAYINNPTKGAK